MRTSISLPTFALCVAALLNAQEFRATISGHVLDPSRAAVPNASVTAVHVATDQSSSAQTDASGSYSIPFLRPGVYRVTVSAPGFKQYVKEDVVVEVGRLVGLDVTLEVGELTESVTVTAEGALLETQTASRVGVVNTLQVSELPLNTRNPFMLGWMMSGVVFRGAAIWQRPFDNGAIADWSVNGGRQRNNEFLLDGAPNNGQAGGNNIAYVPIVDAVQEFSIQQNSYDAQYGHTGGGVFNVVLKGGTNEFHATAWEFLRRKWLDANTYQNKSLGRTPDGKEIAPRPAHRLDQYGFQLEGPLVIPKLLKKDGWLRGFFLGSYEGYYEEWPQFLRVSFPEPEMRQGDFSKLVEADGRPVTIYDPFTSQFDAKNNPIRTPFPGNRIPQSMINPVAQAVTKFMPAPNTVTPGVRYATQNHVRPDYAATDDFYNLIFKFDFNLGDNHRTFLRYAANDRTEDRCVNGVCSGPGMDGQQPFQRINDAVVLDWVGTLSPTLVVNVRASHNRFIEKGFGRGNVDFDLTSLGLPKSLIDQLPQPRYFGRWEFQGYNNLGRYQSINITNNYGLAANITKIAGAHTIKFGLDLRRIHYILQNSGNILRFVSNREWTQRIWNQGEAIAGDSYASFLLGLPDDASSVFYPVYPFFRQWYAAPYWQDDWKVSRRLTLNLGLRWDYNGGPDEKYNRMNRGFDPAVANPAAQQIPAAMLEQYPALRDLKGGLQFAGVGGNPRTGWKRDLNNFQPRVGAAYQVASGWVIRGGYGLYFLNPNNDFLKTNGFTISTPITNSLDGGRTPIANLLSNPYPAGINLPPGASLGALSFVGQNFTWADPTFRIPYMHQFSFGIQRQVTRNSTIEASYVGSRTVGANDQRDFNIPSVAFRKQCNLLEGGSPGYCDAALPNPFRGVEAFRGTPFYTRTTLSRFQLNRPFPQFSGNLTQQGLNTSKIWYNSLQINYNLRVGRSLTLLGNYTLSKMVERWGYNDPYNGVHQQGLYFNERPHYFKFSTVWELPIGRGKKLAGGASGFLEKLIGGWQFSTFTLLGSGEPNDLPGNVIMLKDPRTVGGDWDGEVNWKQHRVVGWNPCVLRQFNDGSVKPQPFSISRGCGTDPANYAWLMTASYAPRATPTRSGQIRRQYQFNIDASLSKMTNITERLKFQFRLEAFNLTNFYYFGRENFNTDPNNPNFGVVFPSQAWIGNGYPRQVQLGFKLLW